MIWTFERNNLFYLKKYSSRGPQRPLKTMDGSHQVVATSCDVLFLTFELPKEVILQLDGITHSTYGNSARTKNWMDWFWLEGMPEKAG